jgi:hypothetical protein
MALHYFGIDRIGGSDQDVVESTSTTGKPIEVVVDLSSNVVKGELYVALTNIREYLISTRPRATRSCASRF